MGGETATDGVVPIVGRDNFFNFCHYYLIYLQLKQPLHAYINSKSEAWHAKQKFQNQMPYKKLFKISQSKWRQKLWPKPTSSKKFTQGHSRVKNSEEVILKHPETKLRSFYLTFQINQWDPQLLRTQSRSDRQMHPIRNLII